MQRIVNPVPIFYTPQGYPLDNGMVYFGVANDDPATNPITVYWDAALTIVAQQPIRTLGGYVRNGATPAFAYVAETDYSIRIADANGAQIVYSPSIRTDAQNFQAASPNLTAIAALATTTFGNGLLTLANVNALTALLGGLNYLPLTGGTVTSDIKRQSSGSYLYNADAAAIGGRVYVTDATASDPTTNVGDIWLVTS